MTLQNSELRIWKWAMGAVALVAGVLLAALLPLSSRAQTATAPSTAAAPPAATQCVPVSNDKSGTLFPGVLIRPRIMATNRHIGIDWVGTTYTWATPQGPSTAKVTNADNLANTDTQLLILDHAPAGVTPATLYAGDGSGISFAPARWIAPSRTAYDAVALHTWINTNVVLLPGATVAGGVEVGIVPPLAGSGLTWLTPYAGCSGAPVFTADGQLLGTLHTTNSATFLPAYLGTILQLEIVYTGSLPGDYNRDGKLDQADYDYWYSRVGTPHPEAAVRPGRPNWDLGDFDVLMQAMGK